MEYTYDHCSEPATEFNCIIFDSCLGDCGDNAVGVAGVRKVPDIRLTSSSVANATTTPARNGRLKYTAGLSWCASPCDSNPYLQVDLRSVHIICAVAIQGNFGADQWVKTYQVQYSEDGTGWSVYQENGLTKVSLSYVYLIDEYLLSEIKGE